jgi:cation transport ATPase
MTRSPESIEDELTRRQRRAAMTVTGMLVLTLALIGIAFVARESIYRPGDPSLAMALWIAVLVFGLGAFVFRRTRFAAMRLQDIAALQGISGLLATLYGTTVLVAYIGGAIALMGFIITILTGNPYDMLRAGGVAVIVLLYSYPSRAAWKRVTHGIEETGDANDTTPPPKGKIA